MLIYLFGAERSPSDAVNTTFLRLGPDRGMQAIISHANELRHRGAIHQAFSLLVAADYANISEDCFEDVGRGLN